MAMRKRRNMRTAVTTVLARSIPCCPARSRTKCRRDVTSNRSGCSPMRPHPGPKGHKEFRLRTWQSRWGRWRDVPRHLKEAHKVACAHKEMAIATTGVVQALEVSQVLTKRLQGVGIQRLQRQASCLGPV